MRWAHSVVHSHFWAAHDNLWVLRRWKRGALLVVYSGRGLTIVSWFFGHTRFYDRFEYILSVYEIQNKKDDLMTSRFVCIRRRAIEIVKRHLGLAFFLRPFFIHFPFFFIYIGTLRRIQWWQNLQVCFSQREGVIYCLYVISLSKTWRRTSRACGKFGYIELFDGIVCGVDTVGYISAGVALYYSRNLAQPVKELRPTWDLGFAGGLQIGYQRRLTTLLAEVHRRPKVLIEVAINL